MVRSSRYKLTPRDVFSTAVVMVVAGAAVWLASSVLAFERTAAAFRLAVAASGRVLEPKLQGDLRATAQGWTAAPLIGSRARSLVVDLDLAAAEPDTRLIERDLSELVSVKPTYGSVWQSMAQMRMVNGASASDVLPLVRLSAVMSPNDGHVMVPRAVFGIQNWQALPESDRARTIEDIAGVTRSDGADFQWSILSEVIGEQDDTVRAALRTRLSAVRSGDAKTLRQLGL